MPNDNGLINTIKSHNPFDRPLVVRSQDIWVTGFPDVPSLNAHASDAIFDAVEIVRTKKQVIGITIKAERGLGKSHLISRIRHQLQTDGSALFVYTSEINDLNRIKGEFLRNLANSLKRIGSQGMSQWRELATAIFNEAYNKALTTEEMVLHFSEVLKVNTKVVEHWTDRVLDIKHEIIENPDIIAAIFWTLSSKASDQINAIKWLAGQELPQSKADALGLANSSAQDREAQAFSTVRQILDLISDYKPIVICFDELESILMCNDAGFTASQVTAILAKDLYDKIKRGVFLTAMFPQTWTDQIRALKEAESVTDRIAQKSIELTYLKSDDVITLVSQWLKDFYKQQEVTPPHSVYPFDEGKLRELGKERPMVRKVLQWCKENWNIPSPLKHPVESAYQKEISGLESKIKDEIEDNNKLANVLRFSFSTLVGQIVEEVQILEIVDVNARSVDQGYINFKIVGKENGNVVKIGVSVLEGVSGMFLQAGLKRLIEYKEFDLTRGCLVRSKEVRNGTKAKQYLDKLLSEHLGGEWVLLKSEDFKPLLAINYVIEACKDYELTEAQIIDFTLQNRIVLDNKLILKILSNPSGKIPEDAIDEEI